MRRLLPGVYPAEDVIPPRNALLAANFSSSQPDPSIAALWIDPDKFYNASELGAISDEGQSFCKYNAPATTLIVERANLLDKLICRQAGLSEYVRDQCLTSVASRIEPSGRLKQGEDLNRARVTIAESIEYGQSHRAGLDSGNKRWMICRQGQYTSPYINRKEPEPRALLRERMKKDVLAGVLQAQKYANEYGLAFLEDVSQQGLEQEERCRTMKRKHPDAFDRGNVITALTMFRNSFPVRYAVAVANEQYEVRSEARRRKMKVTRVSAPKTSPATPPPSPPKKNRLSTHSNASSESFASFVSADTFGVDVKKVKSNTGKLARVARKAALKIPGLRRFGDKKVVHEELTAIEFVVNVACFGESEAELAAVEARLDRVSQWMSEVNYGTDQSEENDRLLELPATPSQSAEELLHKRTSKDFTIHESVAVPTPELPAPSSDLSDETAQRASKDFTIDVDVAVPIPKLLATSSTSSDTIYDRASIELAFDAGIVPATRTTKGSTTGASKTQPATRPDLVEPVESIEELYEIALASVAQLALAEESCEEPMAATQINSIDSIEKVYEPTAAPKPQTSFAKSTYEDPVPTIRPKSTESIEELYKIAVASISQLAMAKEPPRESIPATRTLSIDLMEKFSHITAALVSLMSSAELLYEASTPDSRSTSISSIESLRRISAPSTPQTTFAELPGTSSTPVPMPRLSSVASVEELYHAVATSVGPSPIAEDLLCRESAQAIAIVTGKSRAEETRDFLRGLRVPGIEDPPTPIVVKERKRARVRGRGLLRSGR